MMARKMRRKVAACMSPRKKNMTKKKVKRKRRKRRKVLKRKRHRSRNQRQFMSINRESEERR